MLITYRLLWWVGRAVTGAASLMLAACVVVPEEIRVLTSDSDRQIVAVTKPGSPQVPASSERVGQNGFDYGGTLRVLSWNIHKAKHPGLSSALERYAAENDLLLLQEAVLDTPVRVALARAGYSWQMADAFAIGGRKRGVLVAARITPIEERALRAFEPLFPIPKSAIITRYNFAGRSEQLAVANLHGINFSSGLGRFREQLDDIAKELMNHDGPIIFGGDFNTWSARRYEMLANMTNRLGLVSVEPTPDDRRRAFGRHLDHLFVRGFSVVDAGSPKVGSSDHSPILVRLVARSKSGKRATAFRTYPKEK